MVAKGAALGNRLVFINCPYDKIYKPTFDAIVFAVHDCGFEAVFAGQDVGARSRLDKIVRMLDECSLSIHDLSRVELGGSSRHGLPRFNMAFEAGLAYARHKANPRSHDLILIDTKPHRYHQTLSDASGLDIQPYNKGPTSAIGCVRSFLDNGHIDFPGEEYITRRYRRFRRVLPKVVPMKSSLAELNEWRYAPKLTAVMVEWMKNNK